MAHQFRFQLLDGSTRATNGQILTEERLRMEEERLFASYRLQIPANQKRPSAKQCIHSFATSHYSFCLVFFFHARLVNNGE